MIFVCAIRIWFDRVVCTICLGVDSLVFFCSIRLMCMLSKKLVMVFVCWSGCLWILLFGENRSILILVFVNVFKSRKRLLEKIGVKLLFGFV